MIVILPIKCGKVGCIRYRRVVTIQQQPLQRQRELPSRRYCRCQANNGRGTRYSREEGFYKGYIIQLIQRRNVTMEMYTL